MADEYQEDRTRLSKHDRLIQSRARYISVRIVEIPSSRPPPDPSTCPSLPPFSEMSSSSKSDPSTWGQRTSAIDVAAHFAEHLSGRTVLLTGPTVGGVGYATALALVKQKPKLLILAGRTVSK